MESGREADDLERVAEGDLDAAVARLDLADDVEGFSHPGEGIGEAPLLGEGEGQGQTLIGVGDEPARPGPADLGHVQSDPDEAAAEMGEEGPDLGSRKGALPGQSPKSPPVSPGLFEGRFDALDMAVVGLDEKRQGQPGPDEGGRDEKLPLVGDEARMGQQAAVTVALGPVPFDDNFPALHKLGVEAEGLLSQLLDALEGMVEFGRVDEEVAHPFDLPVVESDLDRVAVEDVRHDSRRRGGSCRGRHKAEQGRKKTDPPQKEPLLSGQKRGSSSARRGMR